MLVSTDADDNLDRLPKQAARSKINSTRSAVTGGQGGATGPPLGTVGGQIVVWPPTFPSRKVGKV
jgi:hypothetical protein